MKNVTVCPNCGNLVFFNSYFGAYICENCSWEDASFAQQRDLLFQSETHIYILRHKKKASAKKQAKKISIQAIG